MLTVITGSMFSGKTSRLISLCTSHVIAKDRVIVFKPVIDNRYDIDFIVSHNLCKFTCVTADIVPVQARNILKNNAYDVVCFDEVQFFAPNIIVDFIEELNYSGAYKRIICAGLPQDSDGNPFGAMPELLCMADEIIQLKAVCSLCHAVDGATKTFRINKNNGSQILVGGAADYSAMCKSCWIKSRGV